MRPEGYPADGAGVVERPGPWQHRYVAANGARFHVAEASGSPPDAPLVVLLHGFPEFWWAWRHQLPALAAGGFRAVAMDLRGYGGSDKPPRGYDPVTLAGDVTGVVRSLGERRAWIVGHGWGGYVGWTAAALHPREVAGLVAVCAPHPRVMLGNMFRRPRSATALAHVLAMQAPFFPERRLSRRDSSYVGDHLRAWSARGGGFPDEETVTAYHEALRLWPASHCALEYHRWLVRSRLRADGRRFDALLEPPVTVPVCSVTGENDPAVPTTWGGRSKVMTAAAFEAHELAGTGHFPHEERPDAFTDLLLDWLREASER